MLHDSRFLPGHTQSLRLSLIQKIRSEIDELLPVSFHQKQVVGEFLPSLIHILAVRLIAAQPHVPVFPVQRHIQILR